MLDKKIIKAIYANVVSHDDLRPVLNGIHFEEGRCYGTDGKVLVIYGVGSKELADKTILQNGEPVDGRYPNVDSVIPAEREEYPHRIDLRELHAACVYHQNKEDANENDRILIAHKGFYVRTLYKLLNVFLAAGQLNKAVMYKSEPSRATVIESKSITAIIMPVHVDGESDVDSEREEGESQIVSYENFINDYAFNHWRKPEQKSDMDWIK